MSALAEIGRPAGESRTSGEAATSEAIRVIEEAEALGIPWREILSREILAESTLQRFLGTEIGELPLWRVMSILPYTLLHCWRARDLVDRLSWEASAEGSTAARREMEDLLCCLTGRRARGVGESTDRARHSWFAYNRVLELQAVAIAAERCGAPPDVRAAVLGERTGAPRRDVDWAIGRLTSPDRSHALDDAMARAREEGFEIPLASSEPQAFARLRRFVSRHPLFRPKGGRSRRAGRRSNFQVPSSRESFVQEA